MKTMVIGDTHGRINRVIEAVNKNKQIGHIIHLGDMAKDAQDLSYIFPKIILNAVDGNNDFTPHFPKQIFVEIGPKKVFATHGHLYGVKRSKMQLYNKAKEVGADIALFAHTHIKYEENKNGILLLNPSNRCYILFNEDGNYEFFGL